MTTEGVRMHDLFLTNRASDMMELLRVFPHHVLMVLVRIWCNEETGTARDRIDQMDFGLVTKH